MAEQSGRGIHFGSGKPVKASIWNEDKQPPSKVVDCLFNPTDYSFVKRNEWASSSPTGGDVPLVNFSSGGAMTLEQMKQQILGTAPVLCDRPAWTLFGVSLAGWNLLASLIMTGCCVAALLHGTRRRGFAFGAPRGAA